MVSSNGDARVLPESASAPPDGHATGTLVLGVSATTAISWRLLLEAELPSGDSPPGPQNHPWWGDMPPTAPTKTAPVAHGFL